MKQKNIDIKWNKIQNFLLKKSPKRSFFNKKFLITIILILTIWVLWVFYFLNLEIKNRENKNKEILNLLNRWINSFEKNYWFYPKNLQKLDEKNVIKPLNLILNKENKDNFLYKKTETWFILELK